MRDARKPKDDGGRAQVKARAKAGQNRNRRRQTRLHSRRLTFCHHQRLYSSTNTFTLDNRGLTMATIKCRIFGVFDTPCLRNFTLLLTMPALVWTNYIMSLHRQ